MRVLTCFLFRPKIESNSKTFKMGLRSQKTGSKFLLAQSQEVGPKSLISFQLIGPRMDKGGTHFGGRREDPIMADRSWGVANITCCTYEPPYSRVLVFACAGRSTHTWDHFLYEGTSVNTQESPLLPHEKMCLCRRDRLHSLCT